MTEAPLQPVRPWRRRVKRVAITVAILYVMNVLGCAAFQDKIIFPGAGMTQGRPDSVVRERAGVEIVNLRLADRTAIVAQFSPAIGVASNDAPTVLFFYGNGMCLAYAEDLIAMFRAMGCNVLCPDYAGYGMSGGRPSEESFYATADACYAHLRQRTDIDPSRIIPVGLSIGGAVAIDLASREKVAGLVTISTFTTMHEMGRKALPWLPTGLILKYRFDSLAKIEKVTVPTLIVHGDADTLIPPEMSKRLFEKAGGSARSVFIPGAGHNDLFFVGGDKFEAAMRGYLDSLRLREIPQGGS